MPGEIETLRRNLELRETMSCTIGDRVAAPRKLYWFLLNVWDSLYRTLNLVAQPQAHYVHLPYMFFLFDFLLLISLDQSSSMCTIYTMLDISR